MRHLIGTATGFAVAGVAGVLLAVFAVPAFGMHTQQEHAAASKVTVRVTATEFKFKLSRQKVPVGEVTFRVTNKGKITHDFKIAGKHTKMLKHGQSATLTVTFKKSGQYKYVCTVPGHAAAGMKGVLAVGKTSPVSTKVAVTATEFKFKLSRQKVPVGEVTFRVTNKGKITHDFKIAGKHTKMLKHGQSATLTVTFKKSGQYKYVCTVPGHAAAGMKGVLAVGTASPVSVPPPTTTGTTTSTTPATGTTTATAGSQVVRVDMNEFSFKLSQTTVKVGTVTFNVVNDGVLMHNFAFPFLGSSTPNVDPGGTATLTVTFTKPGKYAYLCTLPQHAESGMQGTLVVTQ